jgi:hypothetical protein
MTSSPCSPPEADGWPWSPRATGVPAKWLPRLERVHSVGLDIGQAIDPSAVAIVERLTWWRPNMVRSTKLVPGEPEYQCRFLHRLPLGMPYPEQVAYVRQLMGRQELEGALLTVDATGCGRPIYDLFRAGGLLEPVGVLITAGTGEGGGDGGLRRVAKLELVSLLQAHLHNQTLRIAKEARVLASELSSFKAGFTGTGSMTFNARSGAHDDLVLAVSLALWRVARRGVAVGYGKVGFGGGLR